MNNNTEITKEVLEAAKRFEVVLSKRPVEEQLAVGLISKNVLNGCSWEFVRANPEIKRNLEAFKKSATCSVQEVTYNHERGIYGYLVYMRMDALCQILGPKFGGPLNDQDLAYASNHRKEAHAGVINLTKKKYKGRVGIFCTNDSQTITVDGKTFPAFAVTLKDLCTICSQTGYGIVINGHVRKPMEVLEREDAVLKSLTVAPSSNALFIDIAPLG